MSSLLSEKKVARESSLQPFESPMRMQKYEDVQSMQKEDFWNDFPSTLGQGQSAGILFIGKNAPACSLSRTEACMNYRPEPWLPEDESQAVWIFCSKNQAQELSADSLHIQDRALQLEALKEKTGIGKVRKPDPWDLEWSKVHTVRFMKELRHESWLADKIERVW